MVHVLEAQMWYAAVDYMRGTVRSKPDAKLEAQFYDTAVRANSGIPGAIIHEERWEWMGFRGSRIGTCAYGHDGANRYIFQASGFQAQSAFDDNLPLEKYSRIDIQATYWYDLHWPGAAASVAEASAAARRGVRGRPWRIRYIEGYGSGDTAYIGTRGKKSKYLRIYDKWKESGHSEDWKYAWRYEAELTDDHAGYAAHKLRTSGTAPDAVADLVAAYCEERGVRVPIQPARRLMQASVYQKKTGTVDTRLRWLEEQVAPALEKLQAQGVSRETLLSLLGFDDAYVEVVE